MLKNFDLRWYADAALTVVMAANGYPGDYAQGLGDRRPRRGGRRSRASKSSTPAPRPTAAASSPTAAACSTSARSARRVGEAQARAYAAVDRIGWPDGFCRRDIGWQAVKRENAMP